MIARRLVAVLAVVFFALPAILLAVGVRAQPFENRALAPKPSIDAGWRFFDDATRYFVDHMPLREEAVRAYSWTAQHVLHDSPSWRRELLAKEPPTTVAPRPETPPVGAPQPGAGAPGDTRVATPAVLRGSDGWLYVGEDLNRACMPTTPWPVVVGRLEAIARRIRRSGRPAAIVVPPDKSTIYPEHIEDKARDQQWRCAEAGRRVLWPLLDGSSEPALLGLREDLLRAKTTTPDPLFHRKDSHWNYPGASFALGGILKRLGSRLGVRPAELVTQAPTEYTGDLTILLGTPEKDTTPGLAVRRGAGAPVLPGTTLLLHDSFGNAIKPLLEPYVRTLKTIVWVSLGSEELWAKIRAADRVVIEIAERELNPPLGDGARFTLLLDRLRKDPLPRGRAGRSG